jgi:hypothetical protein
LLSLVVAEVQVVRLVQLQLAVEVEVVHLEVKEA